MSPVPFRDLTGLRSGSLTVRARVGWDDEKRSVWLCGCDCGEVVIIRARNIQTGNSKSCGCRMRGGDAPLRPTVLQLFRGIPACCEPMDSFDIGNAFRMPEHEVIAALEEARMAERAAQECVA
jgi:hypothetical protein